MSANVEPDRILTTHAGSLPSPGELVRMVNARQQGETVDEAVFEESVRAAVADVVQRQVAIGVDVVSDGEAGRTSFLDYVADGRIVGLSRRPAVAPWRPPDVIEDDGLFEAIVEETYPHLMQLTLDGRLSRNDVTGVQRQIADFSLALQASPAQDAFLCAPSPGVLYLNVWDPEHGSPYYAKPGDLLAALAEVLRPEYQAVIDAGYTLQVDAPDLALAGGYFMPDHIAEYRDVLRANADALAAALDGLPAERIRIHVCWGNWSGPHLRDIPLERILDVLLELPSQALSIEAANPRHAYEWEVFERVPLPDDKVLILGVIDTKTRTVEAPQTVAQRITRMAEIVGKERVIAGTDCGFATMIGRSLVPAEVCWQKLHALVEGARLASSWLW